jgi:hypothetical protein
MATAEEIVVKLTATTDQLKAGMAEGAAVVKSTQDEMAASMTTSMNAFKQFDDITKQSVQSTQGLAEAQSALQAAQASGAFTTEELAAKEVLVADALKKVGSETQAASGALSMFTRNSRTMYSTSALITDAMTGQYSRMRREVAALGNETGLMAQAFKFAVSPAGLIAAALAAIALDAYNATQKINELQHAVLAGGGASGLSGDQLETMAEGFKKMGFDIQSARTAMEALSGSGRVTQTDMTNATQASLAYAQITGDSIKTLAARFANLGTEGASGFIKLDESMHFLTNSQRDNIAQLQKQGESAQAVSVGYDALATHGMLALQQLQDGGKKTEGFMAGVGTVLQNLNDTAMKGMGFGLTKQDELDKTNKLLDYYKQIGVTGEKINELTQKRADLITQIAQQAQQYTARGAGAQGGIQADEKLLHGGLKGGKSGASGLESELQQEEADQKVSYDKRQEFEVEYWGKILETAQKGSAEYVAAWQHTQDLQKQIDTQQLSASNRTQHQRAEAARKEAEEAKQAAQGRARAEQQASQEIQQEIKQESAARRQAAMTDAQTVRQTALSRIQTARQTAQEEYSDGSISAGQLLQIENSLVQQKLAAEVAYLKAKQALDQGDINAETKDAAQLVVVQQKADQERLANLQKFHQDAERQWRQYTQRVQGMVSSQVTAMLFQHQTLRAAVANIAESMTETWISNEIKQLMNTQAINAAKLAAKVSSDQAQVASTAAAAVETRGIEQAANMKSITSAAASAAAKAFQALAGIPIVGPILGAIAAAGTFVAVEAFGASARGGWERVPADGINTVLHRDEMVLPKHVADPIRNMAKGGGNGGGSTHVHIHAMDARSFQGFLKKNPGAMNAALAHAGRNGW